MVKVIEIFEDDDEYCEYCGCLHESEDICELSYGYQKWASNQEFSRFDETGDDEDLNFDECDGFGPLDYVGPSGPSRYQKSPTEVVNQFLSERPDTDGLSGIELAEKYLSWRRNKKFAA
jgi:hypothetical protein